MAKVIAPEDTGTELATTTDISSGAVNEVNELHKKFIATMKKSAMIAFEIGQRLYAIRHNADASLPWIQFVKENFDFSYNTANNYIKTFEFFQKDPSLLDDKTKTEAYALAGLTGVRAEKEADGKTGRVKFAGDDQPDLDYDIEELFATPCLSRAKLKNYRIEAFHQANRLWLVSKAGNPIPIIQLYATPPQGLPENEQQELLRNVQIAFEKYYERIERYEEKGIIASSRSGDE
jgi:Protein of unknown function (DUF3102).